MNMDRPDDITIVIPVHDRAEIVGRTLASVEAQTLRPLAVVLVDNASTDGTAEVLRQWAARPHGLDVRVVSEPQPGAAAARNRGLKEVETEWTMFFDSDDTMRPGHCIRALEAAKDCDIVGWDVQYHRGNHSSTHRFYADDAQFHSLFHGSMATQRYMARTSLFRRAGGWNQAAFYWNDIELGARLLQLAPRVRHAGAAITVDVHAQDESITGASYSSRADKAMDTLDGIRRTLGTEHAFWADIKAAILAADCAKEGASGIARNIMNTAISRNRGIRRRVVLILAYAWCRAGLRGAAKILKPLLLYGY